MKDITLLLPKVQSMANMFLYKCKEQGYTVILTSTYRDEAEQNALYAQGRTTAGNVVTNAKFGDSMHNYKCAIDFAPVDVNGSIPWGDKALFAKIGEIGESCGFEWGGRWQSFLDLPHLQYTAGYTLDDFKNNRVDYTKFNGVPIATFPVKDTPFITMQKAILAFQMSENILDYKDKPLKDVAIGNKTQLAINKYK